MHDKHYDNNNTLQENSLLTYLVLGPLPPNPVSFFNHNYRRLKRSVSHFYFEFPVTYCQRSKASIHTGSITQPSITRYKTFC